MRFLLLVYIQLSLSCIPAWVVSMTTPFLLRLHRKKSLRLIGVWYVHQPYGANHSRIDHYVNAVRLTYGSVAGGGKGVVKAVEEASQVDELASAWPA